MKKLLFILCVSSLCLFGCISQQVKKDTIQENKIISGKGFKSFKINETLIDDVITALGDDYEKIIHGVYSVEIIYKKLGISFYYKQQEESKTIFHITFSAPFNGVTDKGIRLGDTVKKAIDYYGEPFWNSCDKCDIWRVSYYAIGLEFSVARDKTLPHYPLKEEAHIDKKIIEISVMAAEK